MEKRFDRTIKASLAGVWVALAVGGCANVGQQNAQTGAATDATASAVPAANAPDASASAAACAQLKVAANPGKNPHTSLKKSPPLVYRVKHGDTLARIAQRHHVSVRQLQAWNDGLTAKSRLKLGQVVHVASPETVRAANAANATAAAAAAASKTATASTASVAAASQQAGGATACTNASTNASASASAASTAQPNTSAPAPSPAVAREVMQETSRHANGVALAWPAGGRVVEGFQAGETRGIEIGGKPGDPVRAAADGKVMYAGTGLNSYGSLIIVQHNKDFLTAYSHNRRLLVKTGDIVRQGQQIAEMGDENNSRVSVGFELRRDGKPIDPMPYLPQGRG
ncbi:peptidoglycan DD-metalloendopeptidase family protein [Paraburkholderia sp. D15]|uniref:peptidoglycan DD-metalloendopeptidase family protein n=1 Tax=Paraburkholderia sp. D15 TaxID=2880218 RepID=UPI00247B1BCF|nr:peptidoglycan DD-metalloendopeptidase family protein [Paraburkholderia sp. D15]WGS54723.1 peptidoglycan DD-metalloendopeptidase family protein [Paraburkholderia sp. D15]